MKTIAAFAIAGVATTTFFATIFVPFVQKVASLVLSLLQGV
jgi:hypothetical protein